MDYDDTQHARDAIQHAGGLVSVAGMAQLWGISKQAVQQWIARTPGFPEPLEVYGSEQTRVWLLDEVQDFRLKHTLRQTSIA